MSPHATGWLRLENRHTGEALELRRRRDNGETIIDPRGTPTVPDDGMDQRHTQSFRR